MDANTDCKPEIMQQLKIMGIVPYEWVQQCVEGFSFVSNVVTEKFASLLPLAKEGLRSLNDFKLIDWWTLEGLTYLTLFTVIIVSTLVISINLYRKIRYAIPATVNCWFCNTNTTVLYSLRETWSCPNCQQYNGFTSDGSYNKRIPAQFIEALNRPIRGGAPAGYKVKKGGPNSNGLCSQCNLNQVLKVFQLASFVPVNERNYDAEIEAEQKRLAQLYDICHQCKLVVEEALKQTPDKQKAEVTNIDRKLKVNKVIPNLSSRPGEDQVNQKLSSTNYAFQWMNSHAKDASSVSGNDSDDSFLSLDNLNIGSKNRLESSGYDDFSVPVRSSLSPVSSLPFCNQDKASVLGSRSKLNNDLRPLWKDYPMVQTGLTPTYSVLDTMSCPVGRPAYVTCGSTVGSLGSLGMQYNYQSSNVGSIFGGQKPLISPQKFSNSNSHTFAPHIRFGAYYDVTSSPSPFVSTPLMFNPHYFANPISRSSSQSSGFISQQGGATGIITSQALPTSSTGFYANSS